MDSEQLVIDGLKDVIRIDPATGKEDEFLLDDDFSYAGYQITREEFFAHSREPQLTICGNKLYLNKVCLRKAPDVSRMHPHARKEEPNLMLLGRVL